MARWAFFAFACYILYRQLHSSQDTQVLLQDLWRELKASNDLLLWSVLLLVPLNWGLETVKWRYLVERIQSMPFYRSLAAVLVGTGLGLFTPNRTGEFLGRILFIDPGARNKAAFATALGSLSQFVVTLMLGSIGLGLYLLSGLESPLHSELMNRLMMVLSFSSAAVAFLVYLYPGILKKAINSIPFLGGLAKHAEVLTSFPRKELLKVLGLSILRYTVFAFQFVLAVNVFSDEPSIPITVLTTTIMYLMTTLVPTVVLTELGVRGAVSTSLFVPLGAEADAVLLATFTIWCFNLLLPAVVGGILFVFARIKWRRAER